MRSIALINSISGMSEICSKYDAFLIDQWGVLHNGKTPYSGTIKCLRNLQLQNKNLILLSNSSKRKQNSANGLHRVGIDPDMFSDIITSGEIGWNLIKDRKLDFLLPKERKPKVFVIGNGDDDFDYIDTCNCILSTPEEADFVLARGTFSILSGTNEVKTFKTADELIENISPFMERCAARNLPLLVTNPDFDRPGTLSPMPGRISQMYSLIDNTIKIQSIGKPFPLVYQTCLRSLSVPLQRICGVGDSVDHDIQGALSAGISALWTINGVHSAELGAKEGNTELPSTQLLEDFLSKKQIVPSHMVGSFQW